MAVKHPWCDNFPEWQGCECERGPDHDGPHKCVCGCEWDDDGNMLRRGYQDEPASSAV